MNILSLTLPSSLASDKSVIILDEITGVVQNFINPDLPAQHLTFNALLHYFNEALLGFSLLIFAIMLFVGTMNTAADGQFLGRNWNSVWTPVRLIVGVLFVVPLKTGLCVGQYIFLYVILLGVSIGTYVWDHIVSDIFTNYKAPAVPSYVTNYSIQLVQRQLLYASIFPIATAMLQQEPTQPASSCRYYAGITKGSDPAIVNQARNKVILLNQFYNELILSYNLGYDYNIPAYFTEPDKAISYILAARLQQVQVGSPPEQMAYFNLPNLEEEPDAQNYIKQDIPVNYPNGTSATDTVYFTSPIAQEVFNNVLAAAQAHSQRTIGLGDVDDNCIGAQNFNPNGGNYTPVLPEKGKPIVISGSIPADTIYYAGDQNTQLPYAIQKALSQNLPFCNDIMLNETGTYEARSEIYSCNKAVRNLLTDNSSNGLPQPGYEGFEGSTTVWLGNNPPQSAVNYSGDNATYSLKLQDSNWKNPNNRLQVNGSYSFTFNPPAAPETLTPANDKEEASMSNVSDSMHANMVNGINAFIKAYVIQKPHDADGAMPTTFDESPQYNLCRQAPASGTGGIVSKNVDGTASYHFDNVAPYCSLTAMGSALIGATQQATEDEFKKICDPAQGGDANDPRCSLDLETYKIKTIPEYTTDENAPNAKQAQSCTTDKEGKKTCKDLIGADGKPLYVMQREIEVPLQHSWWNAGASYLIIDNQFAENIRYLIQALRANASDLGYSEDAKATADVSFYVMVEQRGKNLAKSDITLSNCTHGGNTLFRCTTTPVNGKYDPDNSVMISGPTQISLDLPNVNPTDLGIQENYASLIQPYNPNIEPSGSLNDPSDMYQYRVSNSSKYLYSALTQVPADLQGPIAILLDYAQQQSNNGNPACPIVYSTKHNCFQNLTPYLANLLNIMAANNIIGNVRETLPMNAAMDSMFQKMMGDVDIGHSKTYQDNASALATSQGMTSIMNEIYNFGYVDPDVKNIAAQQFSLVQQIRNTGIDILVSCINSMQSVFGHFQGAANELMRNIDTTMSTTGAAAKGTAMASAAMYGVAAGVGVTSAIGSAIVGIPSAAAGGVMIAGSGSSGAGAAAQLAAKIPELVTTGLSLSAQALQVTSTALQTQAELAIATDTITTISNLGVQLMWLPVFLFITTSLITIGVQFAFVIPFMPYIMFWAGQMAWVLGVIEALVAAPLVMLAFAHPGGSDYLGHAAPAVRFLLGIVFRPVLMVIGMLTGILLTYVLIHYSAEGFHVIANSTFNSLDLSNIILSGAISTLLVLMYASFLMMAFTKCFSPIYMLPEKVVQWINGQADRAGEAEAQQFGQHAQQTAQQGAQAGGQALQQGIEAQKQKAQGHGDLAKQSMNADVSVANKGGEIGAKTAADSVKFRRAIKEKNSKT